MLRPNIQNRAFDWMGEVWAPIIDPHHFLGRSAFDVPWSKREVALPAANMKQEGELFVLELFIPGFAKEEITIEVKDDFLTIRGEKNKSEKVAQHAEFIFEEFSMNAFERKFRLSPAIAHEKITAAYENGVLRLTFTDVPKEEEKLLQTVKVE